MNQLQAEKIDNILRLLYDSKISGTRNELYLDRVSLALKVNEQEIIDLFLIIDKLEFNSIPVAIIEYFENGKTKKTYRIQATYNTELFLKVGGCASYYQNLIEDHKKEIVRRELEEQRLRNDIAAFKITKKQYHWNKWIAIAGFVLGFTSLLWQIFKHA